MTVHLRYFEVDRDADEFSDPNVEILQGPLLEGEWDTVLKERFDCAKQSGERVIYFYIFHCPGSDQLLGGESPAVAIFDRRLAVFATTVDAVSPHNIPPRWVQRAHEEWTHGNH